MMSGDYGFGDTVDSQAEGERSQRASQVSGQYGFGPDPGGTGDASKVWLHNAVLPDKTKFYHGRVETDEAEGADLRRTACAHARMAHACFVEMAARARRGGRGCLPCHWHEASAAARHGVGGDLARGRDVWL